MYDFNWKDPLSWVAIGVPLIIFGTVIILIWEGIKWIANF